VCGMFEDLASERGIRCSVQIATRRGEPPSGRSLRLRVPGTRRFGLLLLAAGAATAVVLPGCSENGAVTSEDLIGTWRVSALDFRQFDEDGSFRVFLAEQNPETSTVDRGEFEIEGKRLTFTSNADSAACQAGQRGTYEIQVLEKGPSGEDRLRLIHVEDECSKRGTEGDRTLVRLP
jgi:hypothetical protein